MLADEIAIFLAAASLGLTVGSTAANGIFAVPFPTEAGDTATCVIEYPGKPPIRAMGPNLQAPVFERAKFQVLSRDGSNSSFDCRALQKNIWAALTHQSGTLTGTTGGTTVYGYIDALSSPFFLKFDENARIYYACNFEAYKVLSP